VRLKNGVGVAEDENAGKYGRRDERDLTAGLEKTDEPTDEKQHDVNPQDQCWNGHIQSGELCLISANIQAQNFTGFAFDGNLEWATADFTIRSERLRRDAGVNDDFETLSAIRALNGFGNLHVIKLKWFVVIVVYLSQRVTFQST
jgi:hypothetical protein